MHFTSTLVLIKYKLSVLPEDNIQADLRLVAVGDVLPFYIL